MHAIHGMRKTMLTLTEQEYCTPQPHGKCGQGQPSSNTQMTEDSRERADAEMECIKWRLKVKARVKTRVEE